MYGCDCLYEEIDFRGDAVKEEVQSCRVCVVFMVRIGKIGLPISAVIPPLGRSLSHRYDMHLLS